MKQSYARNCPLCGINNKITYANKYSTKDWILKNCRVCNFVFLENPIDSKLLEEELAWEKTFSEKEISKPSFEGSFLRKRLSIFPRNRILNIISGFKNNPFVLDVGCGVGRTLNSIDHNFTPFGIEISKQQAIAANINFSRKGGKCFQGDAMSIISGLKNNYFDIIILRSFLEHENEPIKMLNELNKKLKPNGLIYIKVPNYGSINRLIMGKKWCGFRFPEHVNYFTPKSLRKAARNSGYKIYKFNIFDRFPTNDNMHIVLTSLAFN